MKIRTGNGVSKWLKDRGFSPLPGRKVAGATQQWIDANGRKATVGYELYSRTGQSSRGFGAVWGYTVTMEDAA